MANQDLLMPVTFEYFVKLSWGFCSHLLKLLKQLGTYDKTLTIPRRGVLVVLVIQK